MKEVAYVAALIVRANAYRKSIGQKNRTTTYSLDAAIKTYRLGRKWAQTPLKWPFCSNTELQAKSVFFANHKYFELESFSG